MERVSDVTDDMAGYGLDILPGGGVRNQNL